MKLKILLRKHSISVIGIVGAAILIISFFPHIYASYAKLVTPTIGKNLQIPILKEQVNPGFPIRLKIPKINVDAAIESIGLTPQGAMGTPKGGINVAWFNLGPRPGDNGSAVIAGHFGLWKNGKGSVFDNLYKLKKGDKLYIKDEKGTMITFVVRESRRYNPNADASDVFGSSDGKAHLNLVTCEGTWDKIRKTYSNRLIVFADKE